VGLLFDVVLRSLSTSFISFISHCNASLVIFPSSKLELLDVVDDDNDVVDVVEVSVDDTVQVLDVVDLSDFADDGASTTVLSSTSFPSTSS